MSVEGEEVVLNEEAREEPEELEVTVEVVPQTVNEIIYMSEGDALNLESGYYMLAEDDSNKGTYEIGAVDTTGLPNTTLTLDDTKSFVLLQPNIEVIDSGTVLIAEESEIYCDEQELGHLKCRYCGKQCSSLALLEKHKEKFHESEYKCKVCGQTFKRAQVLSMHFKTVHETPKYICNICGCACVSELVLSGHYKNHEPKQFGCDVCDAEYDNSGDLINHKKTHTTTMLYACNKCDAEFSSISAVSFHLRQVHAQPKRKVPEMQEKLTKYCELALKTCDTNGNVGKKIRSRKKR